MCINLVVIWADADIQLNIQLIPGCQLSPVPRIDGHLGQCCSPPSWLHTLHCAYSWFLYTVGLYAVQCTVPQCTWYTVQCTRTAALLHISPDGTVLHIGHILRGTCYIYIYICCSTCTTLDQAGRWLPRYTGESLTLTFPLFNHQAGAGKHSTHAPSIEIKLIIVIIIQRAWHWNCQRSIFVWILFDFYDFDVLGASFPLSAIPKLSCFDLPSLILDLAAARSQMHDNTLSHESLTLLTVWDWLSGNLTRGSPASS